MKKLPLKSASLLVLSLLTLTSLTGCTNNTATTSVVNTAQAATGINEIVTKYSSEDLDSSWDPATAVKIALNNTGFAIDGSGASAQGKVLTISQAGTYVISGKLTDGQIIVNAAKKDMVHLVLNHTELSCADNAPIYVKQAEKTILTLADGTVNSITDGVKYVDPEGDDEPDAAIFSKDDLTINGSGSLTVNAQYNHGIVSRDDLVITEGKLVIKAANDGLRGKNSISIKEGNFNITAGGDGLQSNNDQASDKGWIALDGGTFAITAGNDGIQAETMVQIIDGKYTLVTGGGSVNASTDSRGNERPDWGDWGPWDARSAVQSSTGEDTVSAKGIKAGSNMLIKGGNFSIDSSDDALHANSQILIEAGNLNISSGDDGIHADTALTIDGGSLTIAKSYEGIESSQIAVNGGSITVTARDDGFNAAGGNDGSSINGRPGENEFTDNGSYFIRISGGQIYINADGDGIDSNGSLYVSGGTVLVNGPTNNGNGGLDYNGTCEVSGGILAVASSSGMAQAPGDSSAQNSLQVYYSTTQKAGTLITLNDSSGKPVLAFAPAKEYQSIVISSPDLEEGKTYTLLSGGTNSGKVSGGLYTGGTTSGGKKLTEVKISAAVTRISDDGSAANAAMGGPGGGMGGGPRGQRFPGENGGQQPPGQYGGQRPTRQQPPVLQ